MLLFDRTRSLSLHLFEHVHGESRDRGQAMIDLKAQYETARPVHRARPNCRISCRCSWNILSTRPAHGGLRPARRSRRISSPRWPSGCASASRPTKRCSARWSRSSAAKPKDEDVSALLALPDPDANDLAALDAAWEDEPVTFGPGASDGCKDGLIARVRGGYAPGARTCRRPPRHPAASMRKPSCAI